MIWVMYGGVIAGLALILIAAGDLIPLILRTKQHAEAIVPNVLIAKFQKARHDVERVQSATLLIEELVVRARVAVARLRAAVEILRSLLPVGSTSD